MTALIRLSDFAVTFSYRVFSPELMSPFAGIEAGPAQEYWGPVDRAWMIASTKAVLGAYEELTAVAMVVLLARRYGISMRFAAGGSVLFRIAFHLHYGIGPVIVFVSLWATFAVVFFIKTNSIFPLWLAHFVNNF